MVVKDTKIYKKMKNKSLLSKKKKKIYIYIYCRMRKNALL